MANLELPNDEVEYFPVLVTNSVGTIEPAIAGDTYTPTIGTAATQSGTGPAVGAVMGVVPATDSTGMALPLAVAVDVLLNALNMGATAVPLSISDADGLTVFTTLIDVVADATPTNIILGPLAASVPQPVPTM